MLGEIAGIRLPYATLTLALVLVGIALWRALPSDTKHEDSGASPNLGHIYTSMLQLLLTQPRVRTRSLMSALAFASVAAMMATMTALLAGQPFFLSTGVIGVIGLAGVVGAMAARPVGKLGDQAVRGLPPRCHSARSSSAGLSPCSAANTSGRSSWHFFSSTLACSRCTSQEWPSSRLPYPAHERLNSLYMFIYFLGATAGSLIGALAWNRWHWAGVVGAGMILVAVLGAVYIWDSVLVVETPVRLNGAVAKLGQ